MKKFIKKMGNSLIITIDREDADIYDLDVGDIVDIEIMKIKKEDMINDKSNTRIRR